MWTDINTKPKQGATFREFRAQVMGIEPDYCDEAYSEWDHVRPPEIMVTRVKKKRYHIPKETDATSTTPGQRTNEYEWGTKAIDMAIEADAAAEDGNVASSKRTKAPLGSGCH